MSAGAVGPSPHLLLSFLNAKHEDQSGNSVGSKSASVGKQSDMQNVNNISQFIAQKILELSKITSFEIDIRSNKVDNDKTGEKEN